MKPLYLTALLIFLLHSCSYKDSKRSELIDFTPRNASIIIKTSNLESLKSTISNNDFLQQISKSATYKNVENVLENIELIKPYEDILICFSKDKNDSLHYTLITKFHSGLFKTDSLKNYSEEILTYKSKKIIKSSYNKHHLYSTNIDSTFFASSKKSIVDSLFVQTKPNNQLNTIYKTLKTDNTSIIIKEDPAFINYFSNEEQLQLNNFTNYFVFDVDANQNEIILNGVTKATDSLKSVINVFKNTIPQENKMQTITPANSDGFMSITFDNFNTFKTNLNIHHKSDSTSVSNELFNDVIEVGVIYQGKEQAIVLNSLDIIATKDVLSSNKTIIDTYREIDILKYEDSKLFSEVFSPFISYTNANKYCIIDNFFVFAQSVDMLQNIIASYQNKTNISDRNYYINLKKHLSDESSLLFVFKPLILQNIINKNLEESTNYKLKNYNASALQFIYDNNFAHVNAVIKKNKINPVINSVTEELNIKLDADLLTTPQFVTNHITKQKEIVVQDINNNLYLISNRGQILWKKQLHGAVLGEINQIDIYKNGRLQLCFATPNRVYVIDRNGKDVGAFPLKFNDKITQPLSVFDYDKKKVYRLLVTQNKNLLMYDVNGKAVNGFTFKSAATPIISQPKHFRIGSKDYLVFKTNKKLHILDRTGKTRVKPKTNNTYSNQPIFLYKNTFTTTTENGNLVLVGTNGSVTLQNINLKRSHNLTTTSKTLVSLNENKLRIKTKTTELDFGNYSEPKIFYINDKIYVTVTDIQAHKVYLFDSQSKSISNFPVYGNSTINLDNIDRDKNLEFVTKGDSNSILLYQIN